MPQSVMKSASLRAMTMTLALLGFAPSAFAQEQPADSSLPAVASPATSSSQAAPTTAATSDSASGNSTADSPPGHGDGSAPMVHVPNPNYHPGQARRGFVLGANLGVRPSLSSGPTSSNGDPGLGMQGGFAIGFKYKRVMLTVGVDFGATDTKQTYDTQRVASFLVIPGLQVAILRSRDQKVELIGSLRIGAGSTIASAAGSAAPVLVFYEIAPGVRYWAHRQFAVQLLGGYAGQYSIVSNSTTTTASGAHSIVGSLGAIGVF